MKYAVAFFHDNNLQIKIVDWREALVKVFPALFGQLMDMAREEAFNSDVLFKIERIT